MTSRERVEAALAFEPVDKAPLEYHPCGRGLYEHGEAFRRLLKAHPGDFEDFSDMPIPRPPAEACGPDGSYHEYKTDAWGVTWESRIFAMTGHPYRQPLADWRALEGFRCPPHALAEDAAFASYAKRIARVRETRYAKDGWFGFFERMHALRPFEDVLMDVYDNEREINRLADMLVEYELEELRLMCAAGVDAVQFGDDFGTARAMLFSPEVWRSFFKPRYRRLVQFAREQGKAVFFHTCGYAAHAARAKELYETTDYVICAEHPVYGIFELGCWMCGFEDFLYRMALDEEWIHRFFERVLEYQKKVIQRYYTAVGPYIHYTSSGDDFATQNAPFVSPDMFRELIKPYFKERIAYTKRFTKAKYLHHSCGSVYRLIDDLVDCGVEILNPIQPKAADMQPRGLKAAYGEKIVFHGGIDTQELLPFASESQIEEAVHETIEILNRDGGYIFAAAHNIQPDVNPRSLTVMLNAARKYRRA